MNRGEMSQERGRARTVPLVCSCGCTFAHVRDDGALVIVSRHHGQKCVNVVTGKDLEQAHSRKPETQHLKPNT